MLDVLPHGGPLPPGYGDYYGAAGGGGRAILSSSGGVPTVTRMTVQQAVASQPLLAKAMQAGRKASPTSPLAIPDFDTWNVGAGMIEKVPAMKTEEPWYMNKILWAAGGLGLLVGGYFLLRKKSSGSQFAGFGG
jgi:hypothetical protein